MNRYYFIIPEDNQIQNIVVFDLFTFLVHTNYIFITIAIVF